MCEKMRKYSLIKREKYKGLERGSEKNKYFDSTNFKTTTNKKTKQNKCNCNILKQVYFCISNNILINKQRQQYVYVL